MLCLLGCGLLGCDGVDARPDDAAVDAAPTEPGCADLETRVVCDPDCRREACRGDEVCSEAACVPWTEAPLFADFTLETGEDLRVAVTVREGGFPRRHVRALRFDFGDGASGWGEQLRHAYAAPGVYPVRLEVRMADGQILRAQRLAALGPLDEHAPLRLTVNEIPAALNGSEPYPREVGAPVPFRLRVPQRGFTVDVTLLADPDDPIDPAAVTLETEPPFGAPTLTFDADGVRGTWQVDAEAPEGAVTFTARARSASGARHVSALTVEAVAFGPALDPFERPLTWLFRRDTDFFTTRRASDGGLESALGPNGLPDLEEELRLLGAQGDDPTLDARYLAWILDAVREEVLRVYGVSPDGTATDDIPLDVVWLGDPGAPDPATFSPDGDFSMMRFGGVFDGFVGFSGISPHHAERMDDATADRGVATASLLSILLTTPVVSSALTPIDPERGQPVGAHPADAEVLDPGFDPYALDVAPERLARHDTLRTVARYLALVLASVAAHEMGHAMGLMPNGAPPDGFFGDTPEPLFVGDARTDRWHADLPGLNLMQAGGDYLGVIDEALATIELPRGADLLRVAEILALENRLSAYSRAYLQGRLTYVDGGAGRGGGVGCRY